MTEVAVLQRWLYYRGGCMHHTGDHMDTLTLHAYSTLPPSHATYLWSIRIGLTAEVEGISFWVQLEDKLTVNKLIWNNNSEQQLDNQLSMVHLGIKDVCLEVKANLLLFYGHRGSSK